MKLSEEILENGPADVWDSTINRWAERVRALEARVAELEKREQRRASNRELNKLARQLGLREKHEIK